MPSRLLLALLTTALLLPSADARAARPALAVERVQAAAAGTTLTVRVQAVLRARRAKLTFHLSRDARLGRGDVRLGTRTVRRPRRGRRVRASLRFRLPAAVAGRSLRLLACTSPRRCTATPRPVRLPAAATPRPLGPDIALPPGPPPPPSPPAVTPPASGPPTGSLPRTPDPVDVRPVLDGGRAVAKAIGVSGGTLEATAADGTHFRLVLPADTVPSRTTITMTPIKAVEGLPMGGGLVGAVDLQPDGLVLARQATLTITPTAPVPVEEQTAFKFHTGGEDLHQASFAPARELVLPLWHFSSPGVGRATAAERERLADRWPRRTRAQYEQHVSDQLNAERRRQLLGTGGPGDADGDAEGFTRAWWRDVVRPRLIAAETDDRLFETVLAEVLSFERQLQLLGADEDGSRYADLRAEADERLTRAARNAVQRSGERCLQLSHVQETERLLRLAVWAAKAEPPIDIGPAEQLVDRCLRFELEYDATLTLTETGAYRLTSGARGKGELRFGQRGSRLGVFGSVPVESVAWTGGKLRSDGCDHIPQHPVHNTAPLHVMDAGFDLNLHQPSEDVPPRPSLEVVDAMVMQLSQPNMDERKRFVCGSTDVTFETNTHGVVFSRLAAPELKLEAPDGVGFFFDGWSPAGGLFAERRQTRRTTEGSFVYEGTVDLRLRHTPAR